MTQFLIYEGCQYLPETFQAVIFQFNSPLILCLWTLRFQTRGTAAFLVVTHCKPDISARCQWSFHDSPGWFFSTKKLLAERSGWERGELIPCKSSFFFFSPPCITWAQGGADTGGSVAQPRCFTLHTPLEVLLTGDAGQILNICHWSELLRDVLTVRIATSCTCESPGPAIFSVLKF